MLQVKGNCSAQKEIQNITRNYNLLLADLDRKSSWGMINGRPVILIKKYFKMP